MAPLQPHHIIAIGASAGGMEEINSFFDHTPLDGVSYIIIQHLSPDFTSRMVELLDKHSKLVVKLAEHEMTVLCNEVYLIPNDKFMTIQNNKLYLTTKKNIKGPHLTINWFFKSLADDSGKKAIGVILSGLGSDGTLGIEAIKNGGGMVIARNPDNTEFGSMPSSAIATGLVDFVLEPKFMPAAIENYVKHEKDLLANTRSDEIMVAEIITLIKENSALDFTAYKPNTILRRIKRRASYNNFTKLDKYVEFLKETPDELGVLAQDFLISVTAFFRDKEAFEFLQTKVLPGLLGKINNDDELKMWVTGCATGEEAFSLAILLREQLTGIYKDIVVKIFATDVDNVALVHAGKGVYTSAIAKDVSPNRLLKFFIKEGDNYRVKTEIRKMVIFAQHDIVKNPPYCNMHLISCRNMLIYMTPVLQRNIFSMLLFGLKKDGYLFLGSSENPLPIINSLEVVNKKWKIYKNLETKRSVRFNAFSFPQPFGIKPVPSIRLREMDPDITYNSLDETVNTMLVNDFNSLVICIDESNKVIKSYGDTTKFLLQKNFNVNIKELLPGKLAIAFNTLKISALKNNQKASINGIKIKKDALIIDVNLSVTPLTVKKDHQKLWMIIFTENKNSTIDQAEALVFDENINHDEYTVNLEDELKELKDKLDNTYEQLDASNDNMQSFNEELISTNEEMQSTNEEMQSVNEELHTINADYQLKNKELLELNDDLNNYFRSNVNGQLFVNNELLLMKFSPGAVKQINLLPTDVGRPINHISTNIRFETIIDDIKKVVEDGIIINKEIETLNGKWYQVSTMPYIQQANNKRDGAIITFNDITELKKTQLDLDKKNISLKRINDDLDNFINTASHDLLAPLNNIEASILVMNEIEVENTELKDYLSIINRSIIKFRELIKEITAIGKLENNMLKLEMVDVNEIINNIEWSLGDRIKKSGAVITRNLEVNDILFSKKNLRSILYNLISNSLKFVLDKSPEISINTTHKVDFIKLTVKDNGRGISIKDQTKIFDIYNRINHDVDGQGIGLYLAKKIVNAAGGKIEVESELGKGCKLHIYFKTEDEIIPLAAKTTDVL